MNLVTIEIAREHLRIDGTADDTWLSVMIPSISHAIIDWVKYENRIYIPEVDSSGLVVRDSSGETVPQLDSSGLPTVRSQVEAACLIELERQYRSRGGEDDTFMESFTQAGYGYVLGRGSTALLYPLRKPTLG